MTNRVAANRIAFVAFILIQAVLWSHSRYASLDENAVDTSGILQTLLKRSADITTTNAALCSPLSVPISEQCAHVKHACKTAKTFLSIPYIEHYFCASTTLRPFVFVVLIIWLAFLFSTLGISASDFFCPNLATIAERLGLDENVAGVSFLALGNGAPDVFSTFSAMRAGSGALAIGELLGAASFIVSVVAGTMCIIRPFTVEPRTFLRDVGFFSVAIALLLVILWDEKIQAWEAGLLIALYVLYVTVVVIGSWWDKRQFRRKHLESIVRGEYAAEEMPEPYRDDPTLGQLGVPSPSPRARAHSTPGTAPSFPQLQRTPSSRSIPHSRNGSRSPSPSSHSGRLGQMPSFSLAGALEFRHVVASLQHQSAGASLSVFDSPVSPYAGGHYHSHAPALSRRASSISRSSNGSRDSFETALPMHSTRGSNANSRSPLSRAVPLADDTDLRRLSVERQRGSASAPPGLGLQLSSGSDSQQIPLISTTPASPESDTSFDPNALGEGLRSPSRGFERNAATGGFGFGQGSRRTKRQRVMHALRRTVHVLFPTLHSFRDKSFLGKVASLLAAPAVLALTLTLPVHVTPRTSDQAEEKLAFTAAATSGGVGIPEARLVDFEEEGAGVERMLTAEEEDEADSQSVFEANPSLVQELKFNKYLMAAQMVLGPLFCVAVLTAGLSGYSAKKQALVLCLTLGAGLIGAVLVLIFAEKGEEPGAQMARCFMGFIVAVVWIMAIADEVVNVLKTFGFIFGLSDALIGLTIFAVGNSLADFVANISVATFAPLMGIAACFGGPMLNILLGVGAAGTYVVRAAGGEPYKLKFGPTLAVSGIGLLALLGTTMVVVPLRGYRLERRWGITLVISYVVIMVINVLVEVRTEG